MSIPPRFLDELRSRLTLSEIIGKKVKLTRAGREFKACCPFHKEKTPSFTINDDKQFYHCFGCGAHGDIVGFVMRNDNLSFIEAVEALAAQAGMKVPEASPQDVEKAKKQKGLHSLVEDATRWFEEQLYTKKNRDSLEYLLKRGLSEETLAAFRVGYAPADRQALRKFLKAQGYSDAQAIEAGLLKRAEKGGDPYAFFRERIIFPVADRRGRVVAFGGRILPDHLRPPSRGDFTPPKYINSSDTPLFHKSRVLYGESHARQAAADGQSVLVVEGYMDVIAAFQAGFRGAVAPMGTALTEEQIFSLWKMIPAREKIPVLCFDGDNAGRRAAERAASRLMPLLAPDQSARFAFLPEGEDPDSLVKAGGAQALQKILDGAYSLFDFIWSVHTAGRDLTTPESRAGVIRDLQNEIKTIADRDVQKHYDELLRARTSETFFAPRRNFQGKKKNKPASAIELRRPAFRGSDVYPRVLLAAVLNHPHIFPDIEEVFGRFEVQGEPLELVRRAIIAAMHEQEALDREGLHNHLRQAGLERETGDILCESVYVHAAFARPDADSQETARLWLEFWQDAQGRAMAREIKTGWKKAFHSSSREEEERLYHMLQSHAGERG